MYFTLLLVSAVSGFVCGYIAEYFTSRIIFLEYTRRRLEAGLERIKKLELQHAAEVKPYKSEQILEKLCK